MPNAVLVGLHFPFPQPHTTFDRPSDEPDSSILMHSHSSIFSRFDLSANCTIT